MRKSTTLYTQGRTIATGLKAAVVVVVLGVLAATVDHAIVRQNVHPLLTDHAVPTTYAETAVGTAFVVPEELRPNASDATTPVATF